jgi:hypothetical protein
MIFRFDNRYKIKVLIYLGLSLAFATFYGLLALNRAFSSEYIVQDDARQHVFWMQRFIDRDLFPGDLIADYFQSIAPVGYSGLYQLMAGFGVEPLLFSKVLPLILTLFTTVFCFCVCLQLLPVPLAGFISSLLLNQSMWLQDDIASATARAFVYPLFLAFLYYLLKRSLFPCLVSILLQGLFYPQSVLISSGILLVNLLIWNKSHAKRRDYQFCSIGLIFAFLVMLPYVLDSSEFSPVIIASEAKTLPEFLPGGRSVFFDPNPFFFWLFGERSGMIPALLPPLIWIGLFLPKILQHQQKFPLVKRVQNTIILLQTILVSVIWFFAAHLVLFKLYLPSRYTDHTGRIVMALASGIVITILLDVAWRNWQQPKKSGDRRFFSGIAALLLTVFLLFYPSLNPKFPLTNYRPGSSPKIYQFFQQQPKDILIASLSGEANNLPTFAGRSVLVAREYAVPYHLGYYRQFRERLTDLIQAQYSSNPQDVKNFINKYGIDFWLIDKEAFKSEYLTENNWFQEMSIAKETAVLLEKGLTPALIKTIESCKVFEENNLLVLNADCITSSMLSNIESANIHVSELE